MRYPQIFLLRVFGSLGDFDGRTIFEAVDVDGALGGHGNLLGASLLDVFADEGIDGARANFDTSNRGSLREGETFSGGLEGVDGGGLFFVEGFVGQKFSPYLADVYIIA